MERKKEIQETIIKPANNTQKATDEEFLNILKLIAPGTHLRTALDSALRAKKGALIVVENENIISLLDGGFRINTKFTPQKLVELVKMDGVIILSKDMKKINYANVLLTPSSKTKTSETGTRHKAAERTAKEAETFVIAISERKNEITLFYKNLRYPVMPTEELLRSANERMQILEKQRELFDSYIEKLNFMELRNMINLKQATNVIQRGMLIQKITENLNKYIIELGKSGVLLRVRLKELIKGIEKETDLVMKDYSQLNMKRSKILLQDLSYDEIIDNERIMEILGYGDLIPQSISVKGWRMLSKTCLEDSEIANLIREAGSLGKAMNSRPDFYKNILGEERGKSFQEEIRRIKLSNLMNN